MGRTVVLRAEGDSGLTCPGAGVDAWKRGRLLEAGADVIAPDFGDPERLFRFLTTGADL